MNPSPAMRLRWQVFAKEYLVDLCGGKAYQRAGFKSTGNSAEVNATKLLRKPEVQAVIAAEMEARTKRTKIDADWVLKRLAAEADADLADIYDEKGNVLPVRKWPPVFRRGLVVGFEADASGLRKVRLQDRSKTIELIGKHIDVQAFQERTKSTVAFEDMTDEQLLAAKDAALAQLGLAPTTKP